jgi:hypothetical protein
MVAAVAFRGRDEEGVKVDDNSDADKSRETIPSTLACDENTDTFYRPDFLKTVPPTFDATPGQPKLPKRTASTFAAIMRFLVPRRHRARRDESRLS